MDLAGRGPGGRPGVQGPAAARAGGGIVVRDAIRDPGARRRAARVPPPVRPACGNPPACGTSPAHATPPPPASTARRPGAAFRCWSCRARGSAPAPRCARTGPLPSRGARRSRHRAPRGPPSGRRPGRPMSQDRRPFLTRDARLPCPLPVTAASAVLAGGLAEEAARIVKHMNSANRDCQPAEKNLNSY